MAGPAVRHLAFASVLSQEFEVVLAAPQGSAVSDGEIQLITYADAARIRAEASSADVIVIHSDALDLFPWLQDVGKPIVVDGYDPHTSESLYVALHKPLEERISIQRARQSLLMRQCQVGDFFICATETQRSWWLGLLEAAGRINPHTFDEDPTLRKLVDCVPFGVPSKPMQVTVDESFRPFGLDPGDPLLLWGGGVWDWLDPLTAIRAMPLILSDFPNVKLVFPGVHSPTSSVPRMRMAEKAKSLSRDLGLLGKHVFFGNGWVSYQEWMVYLKRASIGLSLHVSSYESHLALRSRVFDYIWAGLPMIVSDGDETARIVSRYRLGCVVLPEDVEGFAQAVVSMLREPHSHVEGFEKARVDFAWERVIEPLVAFCKAPRIAPDKLAFAEGRLWTQQHASQLAPDSFSEAKGSRNTFWHWLARGVRRS